MRYSDSVPRSDSRVLDAIDERLSAIVRRPPTLKNVDHVSADAELERTKSNIPSAMSYASKIIRTANAPRTAPTEVEQQIAQALLDLQTNVSDLQNELAPLQISSAREVDVKGGKKAIVVFVPVPQLKAFHKIQQR